MRLIFELQQYRFHNITPESIIAEIDVIGFSAELLEIIEHDPEDYHNGPLDDTKNDEGLV